ncbi:hypothetical protein L9F63_013257 [Diploptera punctata]|uniref:Coiled-coil domain-containing protein 103 n=1 Tax=Diploptera punctata TaxID=6984 RepID=A0AAD8AAQ0_DIPPU|nr:hypothetical protein L9F63_013257 [Diploptera punctata]
MAAEDNIIDFKALEHELEAAIEMDTKYWRENDAKLRAVEQGVTSYEEFRNLVKAAHLKPLEKKEIQSKTCDKTWNTLYSKNKVSYDTQPQELVINKGQMYVMPRTGADFTKHWKKLDETSRLDYLKYVGLKNIEKLFISDIPVEVFGDLLTTLLGVSSEDRLNITFCISVLKSLSQSKKFNLNLHFLNCAEISACKELLQKLHNSFLKYQKELSEDGITEETIINLKEKYDVDIM